MRAARCPEDQVVGLDGKIEQKGVLACGDGGLGGGSGGGRARRAGSCKNGVSPHEATIDWQIISLFFTTAFADSASQHCGQGPEACVVVGGVGEEGGVRERKGTSVVILYYRLEEYPTLKVCPPSLGKGVVRGWDRLMLAAYCFRGGEAVVGGPQAKKVAYDFWILGNPPASTVVYGVSTTVVQISLA